MKRVSLFLLGTILYALFPCGVIASNIEFNILHNEYIRNQYSINDNRLSNTNVSESMEEGIITDASNTITISVSGNGYVKWEDIDVHLMHDGKVGGGTHSFPVPTGHTLRFWYYPNEGNRLAKVLENGTDITSQITNPIVSSDLSINAYLEIEFEVDSNTISFVDSYVKEICLAKWDFNKSGNFTEDEAASVTDLGTAFTGNKSIFSFEELKYFTGLTAITTDAFNGCSRLQTITFPDSITSIEDRAFSECTNLSVTIPSSVTRIGDEAFYECKGLSGLLTLPDSLKTIGIKAFQGCSNLTGSLIIPNSVTTIGELAFFCCTGLTGSLSIPNSVTTIGDAAFYFCTGLSGTLIIPNTITKIGEGSFSHCSSFTGPLTIPNSVITIENDAFRECSGFTGPLTIPNSVQSIGIYAFAGCENINRVISLIKSPFDISDNVFKDISPNAVLQVPHGTKDKYQVFPGWTSHFKEIEEETATFTLDINVIGKGYALYDGTMIRGKISSFTIQEGGTAVVQLIPDEGYKIKTLKLNNIDVTSDIINDQYSISNICTDTTLEVEFEAISYTLSIKASDNGTATFNNIAVRGTTTTFTVNHGSSATIVFTPDNGNRIKSVKLNNTDVTPDISNNLFTINNITADTFLEVEFEVITYSLSIKASGNGSATYNNTTVRDETTSFTVNHGSSPIISFTPDSGYRIKSVKVNNADVSSAVSNNQYTISNITSDTTLEVEFEAIPPTTYTLKIKSSGNGTVTYNGTAIRDKSSSFTVNEGTSAVVSFAPDEGYRIKCVIVDNADVTTNVSKSQYSISNITANTSLEVEFEMITYSLSIKASGNGSVYYNATEIRGKTTVFTINHGSSATILFSPDEGYRIKSVHLNETDVTGDVVNGQYTIGNITADATLKVDFEVISYSLSIKASGNGTANYNNTAVREKTTTITINHGSSATITFTPDDGYHIKSVKLNNTDVTSNVSNNKYTINNITADTSLEVEFEVITYTLSIKAIGNGIADFNNTVVRGKTTTFTVNHGSSATIVLAPDNGNRIKSVKLNNANVTDDVSNGQYTISDITFDTSFEVEFEVINYMLSIKAIGDGTANYNNTNVRSKTTTFTVNHGSSATISFTPDDGFFIKSVKVNNEDVTSNVSNERYTIRNITSDTSLEVEFEITTYALSIKASGNGTAIFNNTMVRDKTSTFTVNHGSSAVVTFAPDAGYRIKTVKENNKDVTVNVTNNQYTVSSITADIALEVEFEAIPPTTYTLTIIAIGNGSAIYNETTIRSKSSSFTVNEGDLAVVAFTPDEGYRIKSVKVNNVDVTANVSESKYAINNIMMDTSLEVEFEEIPPTYYSVNIIASGNGSVSYNGTIIRNQSQNFSILEGKSMTISFSPDSGYRIQKVKVNDSDVTAQIADGQLTIKEITAEMKIDVSFEAIPPTTYTLTISAIGNGVASYDGITIRDKNQSFTVVEGTYCTILFSPDEGHRVKSVKVNTEDVTRFVVNNQYVINKITADVRLEVEFEVIPPTTWTMTISVSGGGKVTFDDKTVRDESKDFTVIEGSTAIVTITPDNGFRIKSVRLNTSDVTASVFDNQFFINKILSNTLLEVEFEEDITDLAHEGVNYTVASYEERTVMLAKGDYGQVLTVPASFTEAGKEWKVMGVEANALSESTNLAAIIWNADAAFNGSVSNPNLLLYVKEKGYAPSDITNVIVGSSAESITLTDAANGNDFYCPKAFVANRITYEHNYSMKSGYNTCRGWETIVLPFDVTQILRQSETELVPYETWTAGSSKRPFWLYSLTELGWKSEKVLAANTPYLISMPNNENYEQSYNVAGNIQFIGMNVQVKASENLSTGKKGSKTLVPNYLNLASDASVYALNVNNQWSRNTVTEVEGSVFVRSSRAVHPFEAYLTVEGAAAAKRVIPIFDDGETDGILHLPQLQDLSNDEWYSIDGRKLPSQPTAKGLYIRKGQKVRVNKENSIH
ncbi:MAG: leucine-rich repeat domain-containing protein [Bacteroidaceae bacterium]|nr:leucine-rich repeat domain-containing protein [Bacteroidaceae bacterium]